MAPIAHAYWAPMGVRMTYYYRGRLSGMHYVKNSVLHCVALHFGTLLYVTLRCSTLRCVTGFLCTALRCGMVSCVAVCYVTLRYVTCCWKSGFSHLAGRPTAAIWRHVRGANYVIARWRRRGVALAFEA